MDAKKWLICLTSLVLVSLLGFGGIMFILDPALNYGTERDFISYYHYSTLYTNPGIARHYEYDTVLVGTSMIQNTSVDHCEEVLDCKRVRLPYSGGTSFDMATILELCFLSGNDIKTVYWELDQFQLSASSTAHRYPVPEYLYNSTASDDLSYLLNLDIFYHYGLNNILGTLRGISSPAAQRGLTLTGTFSRKAVLDGYIRPSLQPASSVAYLAQEIENTRKNLELIASVVQAHPETEFVFFFPPFSILYWDREIRAGTFDATMETTEYALEYLLTLENVRLYYYQAETDIITNLDNYKDHSHYAYWINDQVTDFISQDRNRVTQENYTAMVQTLRDTATNFDMEALLSR